MKKQKFNIAQHECDELAGNLFMETAGLNREGPKFDRMRKDAFRIREQIEGRIFLRGEYAYFDKEQLMLQDGRLSVGGQDFFCKAFEQVCVDSVEGLYIYACSAGDYSFPEEDVLDQVYADIWGTAFTDAIRMVITRELEKRGRISDSFGPGFYGMKTTEVVKVAALLDFDYLGIEVRNRSTMLPLKSCAGLYFQVNDCYQPMRSQCFSCYGNKTSCSLCHVLSETKTADL